MFELWQKTRYSASTASIEGADEVHDFAKDMIDFAIDRTALESDRQPAQILAMIDENAKGYQTRITGLRPEIVPGEMKFDAFEFVQRIRSEYQKSGLVHGHEMGFVSGCTHIETIGLPDDASLNEFEQDAFGGILWRLSEAFNDLHELRDHIEHRTNTGSDAVSSEILWALTFGFLTHNLWYAIEDDVGLSGMLRLLEKWDEVIDKVREIAMGTTLIGRLWHRKPRWWDRGENAKGLAKKWHDEHVDYWRRARRMDTKRMIETLLSPPEGHDRLGVIVTVSPRAMDAYGGRIENYLREFWTDSQGNEYPTDKVRAVLEAEAMGMNIMEDQRKQGVKLEDVCFGFEELGYRLRNRGITAEEEKRLRNWDWFKQRAGDQGVDNLKKYIEQEKKKDPGPSNIIMISQGEDDLDPNKSPTKH
jgi:hypothetical protein